MQKIEIIRSNRKTLSLEIKKDLRVIVRAPITTPHRRIEEFLKEKSGWLEKNLKLMKERLEKRNLMPSLTEEDIKKAKKLAKKIIPKKVSEFAKIIGVTFGGVSIRLQKTKWGSCTQKGNLNFNCLLVFCPEEVLNYVIIHELCHIKQLNHSKAFWAEVEKHCKNYKELQKWLKKEGSNLINNIK
jgi:predicted metal-dependent hydrolase